jgi:hypothetical protein
VPSSTRRARSCIRGAAGAGYDWPQIEHGSSSIRKIQVARRRRRQGRAAAEVHARGNSQQFGKPGMSGRSADTKNMGSREPHGRSGVERGLRRRRYGNRRVIVLDAGVRVQTHGARTATNRTMRRLALQSGRAARAAIPPATTFRSHATATSTSRSSTTGSRCSRTAFVKGVHLEADAAAGRGVGFRAVVRFAAALSVMIDGANHHVWIWIARRST